MAHSLANLMGLGMGAQSAKLINGIVVDGLASTGTTQADALPLPGDMNVVALVVANSGVLLPAVPQPSDEIEITNLGANALLVYPSPGGSVQGGALNTPFSLPSGATATFIARQGSANWIALASSGSAAAAPLLSSPTSSATSSSTATLGVTTDTGSGTLYWIVSTLNIAPTAVQLLAGQDHSGAAAAASGSQAVSVTGAQTAPASGLTSGTTYFAYFLQVNAGSLQSNIAASASFVPAALATPSLARSSASGAAPLVLSVSDTDFVVGYYFELQISNVLNDTTFLAGNIVQDLIFFMDGADWAALDEAIGLATPSGDYSSRIRAARDNDSGATTVTGKDPQGNNVSFPADVSPWSNVVSDTINVASAVWNSTTGVNKSQYLTISGTPGLIVTGTSGVGTNCGVRTTTSTTGKRHFEVTYTTAVNNFGFGVDDGTTALGPAQFNLPSPGVVYRKDGNIYVNGTAVQTGLATMAQGDVGACEFDTVAGTVTFFKNGVQMGTTVTGVSFSAYYGYCMTYFDDVLTGNFGENPFSMTPTSGFAGW